MQGFEAIKQLFQNEKRDIASVKDDLHAKDLEIQKIKAENALKTKALEDKLDAKSRELDQIKERMDRLEQALKAQPK